MRNYLHHIIDREAYALALPGKFTLCFSLTEMSVWSILSLWSIWSGTSVELKDEAVGHSIEQPMSSQ